MPLPSLDYRIVSANQGPDVRIETPQDWQAHTDERQAQQMKTRIAELATQQREQAAADDAIVRSLAQETGGDWEAMLPRLRAASPTAAMKFETDLAEQRKKAHEAAKLEHENERLTLESNLALISLVKSPEQWTLVRQRMIAADPEMEAMLPTAYDPQSVADVRKLGLKAKEQIDREDKSLELFAKGDYQGAAASALANAGDAETWQQTRSGLKQMGVPSQVLAMFGEWTPDAQAKALELGMTPDQRADNKRAETAQALDREQFGETQRHNKAGEANAAGNLAVSRGRLAQDATREKRMAATGGTGERLATPNARLNATLTMQNRYNSQTKAAQASATALSQMRSSLAAVKSGSMAAGSQGVLVTFQKLLDPESVVKESEYARSSEGLAMMDRLRGQYDRIVSGGAGVPVSEMEKYVSLAEAFNRNAQMSAKAVKRQLDSIADEFSLNKENITRDFGDVGDTPAPAPAKKGGAPALTATPGDYAAYKNRRKGGQ